MRRSGWAGGHRTEAIGAPGVKGQGWGYNPREKYWGETRSGPGIGDTSLLDHVRPPRAYAQTYLQTLTFSSVL